MRQGDAVLVDTSAFYALLSTNDRFHSVARETYDQLLENGCDLWTCSYVLVEFGAVVRNRFGFEVLKTFHDSYRSAFRTIWIDERMHEDAWSEYELAEGNGLSFVDWTVLIAARRLHAAVFTFDSGFRAYDAEVTP